MITNISDNQKSAPHNFAHESLLYLATIIYYYESADFTLQFTKYVIVYFKYFFAKLSNFAWSLKHIDWW